MTDTQYLVRKVQTCPACKGEKFFPNEDWQDLNRGFAHWMQENGKARMDDEAYAEWDRARAEMFPYGEPPEEESCGECEGEGQIETWIDLRQTLFELGYQPNAAQPNPSQKVWCSCGKSVVIHWNPAEHRYEAEEAGWAFSLESNGWACEASHKQARATHLYSLDS
jgi:hypothetical protein